MSQLNGIVRGNINDVATKETINENTAYNFQDIQSISLTNEQMTNALTPAQNGFFKKDSVWFCTDNGTYLKDHFYQFTITGTSPIDNVASWTDLGTLGGNEPIVTQNIEIESGDWVSGGTGGYAYSTDITVTGATTKDVSIVTFSAEDADSGDFASICDTKENAVTIYSKTARDVTIPVVLTVKTNTEPGVPFVPTPELVYTLSADGTYYIVGTGANTIEQIQTWNEQDIYGTYTDGSGLDSNWAGGEVHIPAFYNGKPVKAVNPRAFGEVRNITKMIVQDGQMTTIGRGFMRCGSAETTLTDVVFPTTLTSLGGVAFQYRQGLVNCNLDDTNANVYGTNWFFECRELTSITLPNSVTNIGNGAFSYCNSLTSITISNSVTSIGQDAFAYCNNLTTFNFDGTISQWNDVSLDTNWKSNSSITVVHCTDGDVPV